MNFLGKIATKSAQGKLFSCNSMWPPWAIATVILTEDELTVIYRDFWMKDIKTVHIENISSVEATTGPLFAHVKIVSKFVTTDHWVVPWLLKRDAYKLRDAANGLMSATSSSDTSGGQ